MYQMLFIADHTEYEENQWNTEAAEGPKIRGGGSSNVVGIICSLAGIGLTDLPQGRK